MNLVTFLSGLKGLIKDFGSHFPSQRLKANLASLKNLGLMGSHCKRRTEIVFFERLVPGRMAVRWFAVVDSRLLLA